MWKNPEANYNLGTRKEEETTKHEQNKKQGCLQ
jgi:hypothetical protein